MPTIVQKKFQAFLISHLPSLLHSTFGLSAGFLSFLLPSLVWRDRVLFYIFSLSVRPRKSKRAKMC